MEDNVVQMSFGSKENIDSRGVSEISSRSSERRRGSRNRYPAGPTINRDQTLTADEDSQQKKLLSELLWDWGYFVQPSVKLVNSFASDKVTRELTDIDVYGILMTREINIERLTGDCKTLNRISPINRTFWLKGVMQYFSADRGIIVLRSNAEDDHKLTARSMGITLLDEQALSVFREKLNCHDLKSKTKVFDANSWQYFEAGIGGQTALESLVKYRKFRFWQDQYHRGARYSLMETRSCRTHFKPDQRHHIALVADMATLFSLTLQGMVCDLFPVHLIVDDKAALDNYLKNYLYGGRDSYTIMNSLYQQAGKLREIKGLATTETIESNDLSLPEWPSFLQLFRSLLEHPAKLIGIPRFMRWLVFDRVLFPGFSSTPSDLIPDIDSLTVKLALQITEYFCKASAVDAQIWKMLENYITDAILAIAPR